MKRLIATLLCMLLMVQMVPVISAENTAKAQFENVTAQRGETVSVKLTLQDCPAIASIAIIPSYDTQALELLSGTWLVNGVITENWNPEFNDAVVTFESDTLLNKDVFELVFRVRDDAALNAVANVSCELYVQQSGQYGNVPVDVSVVDGSVTVVCLHEEKVEVPEKAPFCLETGNNRYYTCSCGAVLESDGVTQTTVADETIPQLGHDWSDATCTEAKTCARPGCGATEGASLGHLWTEKCEDTLHLRQEAQNCTEYNTYWFDCARCDEISTTEYFTSKTAGPHIFTEKLEDSAHLVDGTGLNCQDAKEYYYDCAFCSEMGQESFVSNTMGEHMVSTQWTTENDKHFHACTVDGCSYMEDEADCAGGTANCLEKAVCSVCHKEYGKLGNHTLTHHSRNEADHTKPGNIEYWTCDVCGKYFADNGAKTEITEKDTVIQQIPHSHSATWSKNATQHWNECSCGDKINVFDHDYDNTCDTTCNTCGYVRTITHTWENTLTYDGTQHWTACSVCGQKKDVEDHHGGNADCLNKAVCADCKQEYGSFGDHTLTHHSRNEADHTKPGNIEYWTCDVCGKYFADSGAKTEITEKDTVIQQIPHSHSTTWSKDATQHWNECSCGDKINVEKHKYDNTCDTTCNTCGYVRTITHTWENTLTYDGTQHWTQCSVCGQKKDVEDHHGGKADCLNKAVCADCGQKYGNLGNHDLTHHAGVNADHTKPGNIEYWTCDVCGKYYSNGSATNEITQKDTVTPQIPHSHSTTWSKNATQHWNECSCGDKINVFAHDYDNACDTTCNTCGYVRTITHAWKSTLSYNGTQHWTECSVCGQKKDVEDHHGGKADCLNKAVCADCGQAYGQLEACDMTGELPNEKYLKYEATCKDAAVYYKSCTVCGKASTETFSYGQPDDQNHVGGTELRDAKVPSCTEDGYTGDTYCKGCDQKLETGTAIPGGHKLSPVAQKPATHEQAGNLAYYVCSVCAKLYADGQAVTELNPEDVVIPKGEHEYGELCYDANNHWKECACGSKTEEGAHTYGDWVVTKEAAVGVDGSKERECSACGYKQTQKIPAPSTPATGDETQTQVLFVVFLFSALGLVCMYFMISQKKRKYS